MLQEQFKALAQQVVGIGHFKVEWPSDLVKPAWNLYESLLESRMWFEHGNILMSWFNDKEGSWYKSNVSGQHCVFLHPEESADMGTMAMRFAITASKAGELFARIMPEDCGIIPAHTICVEDPVERWVLALNDIVKPEPLSWVKSPYSATLINNLFFESANACELLLGLARNGLGNTSEEVAAIAHGKPKQVRADAEATEQEHKNFLREIANKVYELVRDPAKKARFCSQVKVFCEKNEAHEKEREQLKKAAEADTTLQAAIEKLERKKWGKTAREMTDEEINEVDVPDLWEELPEGYENYVWYEKPVVFCGPPANNRDLRLFLTPPTERLLLLANRWEQSRPSSDADRLVCWYALLTSIHDASIPERPIYNETMHGGDWRFRSNWIYGLWRYCEYEGYRSNRDTRDWIHRAFEEVKADFARIEPTLQDLAEQLLHIDKRIANLGHGGNPFPDSDEYNSNQVIEDIAVAKDLAQTLFIQLKDPQIRETLIALVKLHREVKHICERLGFAGSPSGETFPWSEELSAENDREIMEMCEAELDDIYSNTFPELKGKYHSTLEDLAAKLEADFMISSAETEKVNEISKKKKTGPKAPGGSSRNKDKTQLIAALMDHHGIGKKEVNLEPATQKELEKATDWNQSKVHREMKRLFGDPPMNNYKRCFVGGKLSGFMKKLKDGSFGVDGIVEPDQE